MVLKSQVNYYLGWDDKQLDLLMDAENPGLYLAYKMLTDSSVLINAIRIRALNTHVAAITAMENGMMEFEEKMTRAEMLSLLGANYSKYNITPDMGKDDFRRVS